MNTRGGDDQLRCTWISTALTSIWFKLPVDPVDEDLGGSLD